MIEFLVTGLFGCVLIALCSFIIYEIVRFCWSRLPSSKGHPLKRMLMVVASMFAGHIINIWIFGGVYYTLIHFDLGNLATSTGALDKDIFSCIYFSSVIYTTVGLGDVVPQGALRMIVAIQGLCGFIMIGWTVTFTYLAMEKFWAMPHRKNRKKD
jgi:hypothetical protein